jgi:CDP-glucose 4,6-dehydratase
MSNDNYAFYGNKNVLVTGATGFKGAWLCSMLLARGANVTGYSLAPADESLFNICGIGSHINNIYGDICDFDRLYKSFKNFSPEIVFHLAAQPDAREGYANPALTYETNMMGTVNILECVRMTECVRSFINVSAERFLQNIEHPEVYGETVMAGDCDPFSVSKACSEQITHSYIRSFFRRNAPAISTTRAGNSIGGGDFSEDRIVPDFYRAVKKSKPLPVRNQNVIRPYLHVLDTLNAYMMIAEGQYEDSALAGAYNIGPGASGFISAGALAELLCSYWGGGAAWYGKNDWAHNLYVSHTPDYSKIAHTYSWRPVYSIEETVRLTADWYKSYLNNDKTGTNIPLQIEAFNNRQKWSLIKVM